MMKKKAIITAMLLVLASITTYSHEFTWSKYELICYRLGQPAIYEKFLYLANNGQCLLTGDEAVDKIIIEVMSSDNETNE